MSLFKLHSAFKPAGDQPEAIRKIVSEFGSLKDQVLVGVTGSGKTFTMANVIRELGLPALVISHNKTLAAQHYSELAEFFPENAVEYFVSYYDYYQPEAYIPHTDTYIEKDASINDDLDRLRLRATSAVLSRRDTIIVSSVSCIYGLGAPEDWMGLLLEFGQGEPITREELLRKLVSIQYERADQNFKRGTFRVRGDIVDIFPSYEEAPFRIELGARSIGKIARLERETSKVTQTLDKIALYPAKHFVTPSDRLQRAILSVEKELGDRLKELKDGGKLLEAQRLESRTLYDLEMLEEVGYCSGIENYSRHLSGREAGSRPYTLIDYFPKPFLIIIDESHVTVPQLGGMYQGDYSRKKVLVEHGFRLPSALDNRPLRFAEFERMTDRTLYVSATPGPYELRKAQAKVEQLIRPTGLMDPEIEVRSTEGQIDDLIKEIKLRAKKKERTLVTTLTKRMAEDLSRYLKDVGIRVHYLHSEFDAIERVEILRDLRLQKYDCVVGINLLREGLDLPEVSLVLILDADKEGFLRSSTSLIQIAGRAARHASGKVIMYADRVTDSMKTAIDETARRRRLQEEFNREHGIAPRSIQKAVREGIEKVREAEELVLEAAGETRDEHEMKSYRDYLRERMERAASALDFGKAAKFRDQLLKLEKESGREENGPENFRRGRERPRGKSGGKTKRP